MKKIYQIPQTDIVETALSDLMQVTPGQECSGEVDRSGIMSNSIQLDDDDDFSVGSPSTLWED